MKFYDRENEIDIIAINEFDHTGVIAEVKCDADKINFEALKEKASYLPSTDFGKYAFEFQKLSIDEM